MIPRLRTATIALCASILAAGSAHAGGLTVPDNGTVAIGRAGAFAARASDPTAIMYDTAGILGLDGVQITLGSNFGLFRNCFQRAGNYPDQSAVFIDNSGTAFADSHYADGGVAYPQVCRAPAASIVPHLLATWRIHPRFAIGLGAYGPNSPAANAVFPDTVQTPSGLAPSPARYLVYEKNLFLIYPTLALAWAPADWLRIGATIQPSWAQFHFTTMVNTAGTQSPASDLRLGLDASGFFFAGSLSVQILPSPYFSLGTQMHVNQRMDLSGTGTATSGFYASDPMQRRVSTFSLDRLDVQLPVDVRAGARFVLPRAGHATQTSPASAHYDPMRDDVFDLEADFFFEADSMMSTTTIRASGMIDVDGIARAAPSSLVMQSNARDVFGVRVGGDINVIPDRLAVRAGVAYDNGAQSTQYAVLHLASFDTVSVHVGASVRYLFFTASLAYAHYFMADFNAFDGQRSLTGPMGAVTQANCMGSAGADACMINRGLYSGALDTVSVALSAHF